MLDSWWFETLLYGSKTNLSCIMKIKYIFQKYLRQEAPEIDMTRCGMILPMNWHKVQIILIEIAPSNVNLNAKQYNVETYVS